MEGYDLPMGTTSGAWGGLNIGSWESFAQDMGRMYLTTKTQYDYNPQIQLAQMQLQAQNQFGQQYFEGLAGRTPGQIGGIPTGWLLLGGLAVVALVLTAD